MSDPFFSDPWYQGQDQTFDAHCHSGHGFFDDHLLNVGFPFDRWFNDMMNPGHGHTWVYSQVSHSTVTPDSHLVSESRMTCTVYCSFLLIIYLSITVPCIWLSPSPSISVSPLLMHLDRRWMVKPYLSLTGCWTAIPIRWMVHSPRTIIWYIAWTRMAIQCCQVCCII